jgi:hypothetical protein
MLGALMLWGMLAGQAASNPYLDPPTLAVPTENPFEWEARKLVVGVSKVANLELVLHVPPGTEVYRDQLEVEVLYVDGVQAGQPDFPPPVQLASAADGQGQRPRYISDVIVYLPVTGATAAGDGSVYLRTRHQGCRGRLCFPPVEGHLTAVVNTEVVSE